jgi:hypothetical protein
MPRSASKSVSKTMSKTISKTTSKRIIVSLFVFLFLVAPVSRAASSKRRSVRSPAAPVTSSCHTFGLVRAGLKASYLSVAPGGNVTFQVTYISDTPTQTKTTQKVQAPSGNADVTTTLDGEVVGNLRGLKHIKLSTTTTVPVLGAVTTDTNIDFVPSLIAGPAAGWCTNETWNVSPVTETVTTTGSFPVPPLIITTVGSVGQVLAVDTVISVPAGSFHTVKYRSSIVSGTSVQPAITWVSMADNIVVKQDTLDAGGNVTTVTELQKLE